MNHRDDHFRIRLGIVAQAAVIALAAAWVFWPAIRGGWLWDDVPEIVQNSAVHDPAGMGRIWLRPAGPDYFPLKTSAQWMEWRLWGDNPTGYHLTNIGLHILSALLLWRLLNKLGVRWGWIGGLLFAVHPLAVESVAWITELKNTLSLPPLLLAMICYVDFDRTREAGRGRVAPQPEDGPPRAFLGAGAIRYFWSIGFFLAAMLCKSSVVMFPVVILLYAWWRRGRITRADARASAPFFAISLALGLVTVWFQQQRAIAGVDLAIGGLFSRLAGAGLALAFYFGKGVLPVGLSLIYPRWNVTPPSVAQFLPWVGLAATVAWLWTKRTGFGRHVLFGLGFFVLNLLPVLGLVPMAYLRLSWVADHFAYLPLLGLVGLAAAGLDGMGRSGLSWLRSGAVLGFFVAILVGTLAWESRRYAGIFRDEETLWTYTVERNPNAWVARHGLGLALLRAGRLQEAQHQFEKTLLLNPSLSAAHFNLGNTLSREGQRPAAIAEYREAVRLKPDYAEAWYNFANLLAESGELDESSSAFAASVRLRPDYADAHVNYGNVLTQLGRGADAVREYQAALRLEPGAADVRNNLGGLLAGSGHWEEAKAQFEEALRLKPDYREARDNLERVNALERAGTSR